MATHVLDISHYSFQEILNLFNLTYTITEDDLRNAKKKVLMTHPDKSRLPPEYFLFYKKAFDIVVEYYKNNTKQNVPLPEKCTYQNEFGPDAQTAKQVHSTISKMDSQQFNTMFNKIFDKTIERKVDTSRNEWFSREEPVYSINEPVTKTNMNAAFEQVKERQQAHALARYTGVSHIYSGHGMGTNFYEEIDDEDEEYVTADIFSKLKFEDIRKVHKDQTVFSVSEREYANVPKYASVEQFERARSTADLTPLERARAEQILAEQTRNDSQRIQAKLHKINQLTDAYGKKSNDALSAFLLLK